MSLENADVANVQSALVEQDIDVVPKMRMHNQRLALSFMFVIAANIVGLLGFYAFVTHVGKFGDALSEEEERLARGALETPECAAVGKYVERRALQRHIMRFLATTTLSATIGMVFYYVWLRDEARRGAADRN